MDALASVHAPQLREMRAAWRAAHASRARRAHGRLTRRARRVGARGRTALLPARAAAGPGARVRVHAVRARVLCQRGLRQGPAVLPQRHPHRRAALQRMARALGRRHGACLAQEAKSQKPRMLGLFESGGTSTGSHACAARRAESRAVSEPCAAWLRRCGSAALRALRAASVQAALAARP